MRIEKDYEDLLRLFNKHKVSYCIIGAYAVAFYAQPRYTKDMDILVEPAPENAHKIITTLKEFGFKKLPLKESDMSQKGQIIQLGYEPIRIDIVTSIDGCEFKDVWKNRTFGTYGRQRVPFIGLKELIKNKRVLRRPQDKIDLANLRKSHK